MSGWQGEREFACRLSRTIYSVSKVGTENSGPLADWLTGWLLVITRGLKFACAYLNDRNRADVLASASYSIGIRVAYETGCQAIQYRKS